jgi:hypothetical protein
VLSRQQLQAHLQDWEENHRRPKNTSGRRGALDGRRRGHPLL